MAMGIEKRLTDLLRRCQLVDAINELRPWLATATYADIRLLCSNMPERLRRHAVLLIKDILTGYPEVLYGAPVLIWYDSPAGRVLTLPLPEAAPDTNVVSVAWTSLRTLRQAAPFAQRHVTHGPVVIQSNQTECSILLVQCKGTTAPEMSDEWWSDVFRDQMSDGRIRISSRILAPYPEALEAACSLFASANSSATGLVETPQLFLSDESYAWAQEAGQDWRKALAKEKG